MDGSKTPSIKKNYFFNLIYTLLNTALPLITAPYLARTIGVEGTGKYAVCYSVAYFFFVFAKLGLGNYGTREISKSHQSGTTSKVFSEIYAQQVPVALIVNLVYLIYIFIILRNTEKQLYALLLWTVVIGGLFDIDWLFSGLEEFKLISVRNSIVKISTVISIFCFVKDKDDLWKYVLLMGLGYLLGNMSMWVSLRKYVKFQKVSIKEAFKHFYPSLVLVVPILASSIYRYMDKIMLGNMDGMYGAGLYENAEKIIFALCGFINAFGAVMMPRMTKMVGAGEEKKSTEALILSLQFMMCLMFGMAFGLLAVSNQLVIFAFDKDFAGSGVLLQALGFSLPAIGWSNVIRTQYVVPTGQDKIFIYTVSFGAIVNLIVNFICIPKFGAMGAVIGTLFAEFGVGLMQYILLRKKLPYGTFIKKIIFAPVCGLIMYLIIIQLFRINASPMLIMFIQVICGMIIYAVAVGAYIFLFEKEIKDKIMKQIKKWRISKI